MTNPDRRQTSVQILEVWQNGERSHLSVRAFDNYAAYVGTLPLEERKRYDIGLHADPAVFEEFRAKLRRIPNEHVYPTFCEGMTLFPMLAEEPALDENYFYKKPNLSGYCDNDMIARDVFAEAKINETLLRHPHPNLAVYAGCLVRDGLIVSLVFRRYSKTLFDRVSDAKSSTEFPIRERDDCMDKIEGVAKHIHRLGLAHNDITPSNILFDHDNEPVLLDWDSCALLGNKIVKGGHVTGWRGPLFDDGQTFDISSVDCDVLAIQFLRRWLQEI